VRASYHTTGRSLALFARSVRQELYYDSFSDALVRFLEALTHQDDSGAPIPALQGTVLAASAVERGLAMCRYCKNYRLYSTRVLTLVLALRRTLTRTLTPTLKITLPLPLPLRTRRIRAATMPTCAPVTPFSASSAIWQAGTNPLHLNPL
jgi:hypothetical protein